MKSSELLTSIWKYQEPICQFLGSASSKTIREFRSQQGVGGVRTCTFALLWEINKKCNNFDSPDLQQWIQSQNTVNNPRAYEITSEIETEIMNYITDCLKDEFGEDAPARIHPLMRTAEACFLSSSISIRTKAFVSNAIIVSPSLYAFCVLWNPFLSMIQVLLVSGA